MSEENVEIALAGVDAWNRGDHEAWLALWDEEAEFHPLRAQLEGESYSLGVLTRIRRGKIVYTRFFSEPADALEAAGLSE